MSEGTLSQVVMHLYKKLTDRPEFFSHSIKMLFHIIWSRSAKTCLRACADSEDPDQPAHPRSLIRAFDVRKQNNWIL